MELNFRDLTVFSSNWEECKETVNFGFEAGSGTIKVVYKVNGYKITHSSKTEELLRPYATQRINLFVVSGKKEGYEPFVLKNYAIDIHSIIHFTFIIPTPDDKGDIFEVSCSVEAFSKEQLKEIKSGNIYSIKLN